MLNLINDAVGAFFKDRGWDLNSHEDFWEDQYEYDRHRPIVREFWHKNLGFQATVEYKKTYLCDHTVVMTIPYSADSKYNASLETKDVEHKNRPLSMTEIMGLPAINTLICT